MVPTRYIVSPDGHYWKISRETLVWVGSYQTKQQAIDGALRLAKADPPSQVLVRDDAGRFQVEWTSSADPPEPAG